MVRDLSFVEELWKEWGARDESDPDWEMTWVDRFREAVPDPERQYLADEDVADKSEAPWGLPVYRVARADDAFGMVWRERAPLRDELAEFDSLWVYLLDPVAVLATYADAKGGAVWIMDKGLMRHEELTRL